MIHNVLLNMLFKRLPIPRTFEKCVPSAGYSRLTRLQAVQHVPPHSHMYRYIIRRPSSEIQRRVQCPSGDPPLVLSPAA